MHAPQPPVSGSAGHLFMDEPDFMILFLIVTIALSPSFAKQVQDAYAHQNSDQLRSLLPDAEHRVDSLLVRYRLYPLTQDGSLVENLPDASEHSSARELALLSGLWSYRAGEASIFSAVSYGRRSTRLLERAKAKDPNDPYVLLVEGQSLLFRPAIAGRDSEKAAECFSTLARQMEDLSPYGVSSMEAKVWKWLALRESEQTRAAAQLRTRLLSRSPPPLYAQFLRDPPEV